MMLAKFNYNNKDYVYILNNENIEYGFIENDNVNKNIMSEEKEMMDCIFSKITISNNNENHFKCGIVIYNNKKFQVMFDKISERKFFYEVKNSNYFIPNDEDNYYLNDIYNPVVMYNGTDRATNIKKMIVKFNCGMAVVLLSVAALKKFDTTPAVYKIWTNIYSYEDSHSEKFSIDKIKNVINNNDKLSEEEKDFIFKYFYIIEENSNHISMKVLKDNFAKLDIKYDKQACSYNKNVLARNNIADSMITIYNANSFEEVMELPFGEQTLLHEIIHSLTRITNLGMGLSEAITETMSCEYTNYTSTNSYENQRKCLYALLEIIDNDNIKEFYFKGDATILVDSLAELINDEDMAYELIGEIDLISQYEMNVVNNNYDTESTNQYNELKNDIYNKISKYFEVKYGYDMTEDELMMNYLVMSGFATLDIKSPYVDRDYMHGINRKGYFSSDYISEHPNASYCDRNKNHIVIPNRINKIK